MILGPVVLCILTSFQTPCADASSCRALAVEALQNKDYEAFHDLAWAAYRKGRSNDPESMLLVARAQSLSGRPGDALVMLERITALGAATDVATSDDFARVRALPRWEEVAAKLSTRLARSATAPAPSAAAPAPSAKPPAPAVAALAPSAAAPAPPAPAPAPSANPPAPSGKASAPSGKASLNFTTLLTPTALVYDAVSRRFIIADRNARRIAVIDETTGQVATLVGAQAALGHIAGMAIDPQQGDLWVVTTAEELTVLHRLQLISGRSLSTLPLSALRGPVVAMAFARGTGIILADSRGVVWRVRSAGTLDKLGALEYVPRGFATDAAGRLYVAGGVPRLARFVVGASLRKVDVIDIDDTIPVDAPFAVAGNRLLFIVPIDGSFEIRTVGLR